MNPATTKIRDIQIYDLRIYICCKCYWLEKKPEVAMADSLRLLRNTWKWLTSVKYTGKYITFYIYLQTSVKFTYHPRTFVLGGFGFKLQFQRFLIFNCAKSVHFSMPQRFLLNIDMCSLYLLHNPPGSIPRKYKITY